MIELSLLYKSSFYIVALVICFATYIFAAIESWTDRKQTRLFMLLLGDVMVSAIGGIVYKFAQPVAGSNEIICAIMLIFQFLDFFAHTALAPLFFVYVQIVTGSEYSKGSKRRILFSVPFFIVEGMVLLNPFVKWIYYFDENYVFHRNWGETVTYVVAAFYFILAISNMIFHWYAVNRRRRWGLLYCFLITLLGIVIQLLSIELTVELVAESMGLVLLMLIVEREEDRIDEATRTYNRSALYMDLNNYFRMKRHFHIIYLRVLNYDILQRLTGSTDNEQLYQQIALYLREVHSKYQIYRPADTSFILICHDDTDDEVQKLSEQIKERFTRSFSCQDVEARLDAMILWTEVPEKLSGIDEIMQLVDSDVPNLDTDQVYSGEDIAVFMRSADLEKALHIGLTEHNYHVCYQPIYTMRDKSIYGAEAEIRLNDPKLGEIEAAEFMPIAKKHGIHIQIEMLLLEEVFTFLGSGIPTELGLQIVSVDLPIELCLIPDLIPMIGQYIHKYNVNPMSVNFELHEPSDVEEYEKLKVVTQKLKEMCFSLSLENYGKEYSNMASFTELGFERVNISMDIIGENELNPIGQSILKHSIRMLRDMHLKILIKEGKNKQQVDWIENMDVDYLQSDYYSRVVTQNELISILKVTEMARRDEQRARAGSEAKSNFLANMSHEIRTPINAILGMNEMILRESKDNDVLSYSKDIENAGKSLLALINDILDFSKIEAGNMEIVEGEYELSSLINDVVNMIQMRAEKKGLSFHLDVDEELPERLYGDEIRIRQILLNLLNNAVKYTHEGSVILVIRGVYSSDHMLRMICDITDTGIGIRDEDKEKLFKTFQRLDMRKNRTIEGSGLGLAITYNLLNLMDGSIQVKSEYGQGSTFTVAIPQHIIDQRPIGNIKERYQISKKNRLQYQESFIAPEARILVVDDTPINLTVIQGLLKQTQIQIDTAGGGKQCLAMSAEKKYDIIFLDYRMPEMDGITTLQIMKGMQDYKNADTPVILLTANALSGARERFLAEGFDDYLTKPVNGSKLEAMLVQYLPEDKVILQEDGVRSNSGNMDSSMSGEMEGIGQSGYVEGQLNQGKGQSDQMIGQSEKPAGETQGAYGAGSGESVNPAADGAAGNGTAPSEEEELLYRLRTEVQLDTEKGLMNCGSLDAYKEILLIYRDTIDSKAAEIEQYYTEKDYRNYTIQVHSLKSTSRIIGAFDISERAWELEQAGDREDVALIEEKTESLLKDYRTLKERMLSVFPVEDAEVEEELLPEIDGSMLQDALHTLQDFVQMMDYDDAVFILDQLSNYQLPKDKKSPVDQVRAAVDQLNWVSAEELLKEVIE